MNHLNTLGNRHIASLNADLAKMETGEGGPSVQGSVSTTLGALSRLIDDYDSLARKEMVSAAREKANVRVARLQTEHRDLKARFEHARNTSSQRNREGLLSTSSSSVASPSSSASQRLNANSLQRRGSSQGGSSSAYADSPYSSMYKPNHPLPGQQGYTDRESFAMREDTFLQDSERNIDQYIAQGRAALENLVEQRGILKGTQRRLRDAANTLGLSRETIGWVERRTKQDGWIFGIGATVTLFCFWLIWHYLG